MALFGPTSGSTGVPKITMHFHRDILSIDNTFGRHDPAAAARRRGRLHGAARVHLRPRHARRLPAAGRRVRAAHRAATPAQLADIVAEHGVTVLATAPTAYKADPARPARSRPARRAAHGGQRGRAHPAGAPGSGCATSIGLRGHRRHRRDRAAAHLHLRRGRRHQARRDRQAGARLSAPPILGPDGSELGPASRGTARRDRPGRLPLPRRRAAGGTTSSNGWNVTGDTFTRDEDGYFYYQARTDNMIVSSGYNIGGPEVEAAIDTHPDVARVRGRRPARTPSAARSSARSSCCATACVGDAAEGQGDPGLRQEPARAVQVPARRPLRRRAAAQRQRQAAALRAAARSSRTEQRSGAARQRGHWPKGTLA